MCIYRNFHGLRIEMFGILVWTYSCWFFSFVVIFFLQQPSTLSFFFYFHVYTVILICADDFTCTQRLANTWKARGSLQILMIHFSYTLMKFFGKPSRDENHFDEFPGEQGQAFFYVCTSYNHPSSLLNACCRFLPSFHPWSRSVSFPRSLWIYEAYICIDIGWKAWQALPILAPYPFRPPRPGYKGCSGWRVSLGCRERVALVAIHTYSSAFSHVFIVLYKLHRGDEIQRKREREMKESETRIGEPPSNRLQRARPAAREFSRSNRGRKRRPTEGPWNSPNHPRSLILFISPFEFYYLSRGEPRGCAQHSDAAPFLHNLWVNNLPKYTWDFLVRTKISLRLHISGWDKLHLLRLISRLWFSGSYSPYFPSLPRD